MNSGKVQSLTKNVGLRSDCGLKLMLGIVAGVLPAPVLRGLVAVGLEAAMMLLQISNISSLSREIL